MFMRLSQAHLGAKMTRKAVLKVPFFKFLENPLNISGTSLLKQLINCLLILPVILLKDLKGEFFSDFSHLSLEFRKHKASFALLIIKHGTNLEDFVS
jgi:hypothetical protein